MANKLLKINISASSNLKSNDGLYLYLGKNVMVGNGQVLKAIKASLHLMEIK